MRRKIAITLLIAIITTMMSLCTLATNDFLGNSNDIILISRNPNVEYISSEEDVTTPIMSNDAIKVQLDGNYLDFTDENGDVVNPEIINDRTMVPMRKIFETFNAEVKWDAATRTVVATTEEKEITLTINNNTAKLKDLASDEEKEIELDSEPVILNNRTMVPVRFIAESLEKEVAWDSTNRTVVIIDFDKVEKTLEEKVPVLKELFEIELEPVESFKSTSKIKGELVYKDPENKSNNETVKLNGELKININKAKEMEIYFDLSFSGKGTIYNSIKEAGYEKLEFAVIIVDNNSYMMMKQDGEEIWANMGEISEMNDALSMLNLTDTPNTYGAYVETLKNSLGDLDVTSYATMQQLIEVLSVMYNEDTLKISGTDSKKTLKMEIDFKEMMTKYLSELIGNLDNMELTISMEEKIVNKKIDNAEIELKFEIEEPTTKEKFELELLLDMEFSNTNKDFVIKAPKVTAE